MTVLLAFAAALSAGTAQVKITPPDGAPMAGYYYERGTTGVHDDLWAKSLVLEAGGERAALVACDLIHLTRGVVSEAKRLIEQQSGLKPHQVMISATHAHTGPVVAGGSSRYETAAAPGGKAGAYAKWLPGRIAESVRLAAGSMRPSRAFSGSGNESLIAFNRRFHMSDGTVGWNPGKMNPKIVKPAGPVDPEVPVVYIQTEDGKPLITYVNYALHLDTVGGTEVSADYPYTLSTLLTGAKGGSMLTLFTIGCAGNVNHIDVRHAKPQKGHEEAARIGTVLAGEVMKTWARMVPAGAATLVSRMEIARLPLAPHRPEDVEWAKGIAAKFGKPNAAPFLEMVKAFRVLDVEARKGKPLEAQVQVIALGNDIAWVGLPGEIFVELGMAIKRASPFNRTIVVSLANDNLGYIPNSKAYSEGNYEVVSARCAGGSGEILVETAGRMLKEMYQ
ncbi:MAG: hypothetical protein HXY18_05610 [Bryobacteraceae bacterium]|nr:hypothetical protein [Bryobacteraceae bacterium]